MSVCEGLQAITENRLEIQLREFLISALAGGQKSAAITGPLLSFISLWQILVFITSSECRREKEVSGPCTERDSVQL